MSGSLRKHGSRTALAYYVSAHGYGHGVRSCDIIRALNDLRPDLRIHIVTDLPISFLMNRLQSSANSFRGGAFDSGMVQLDSIRVDVPASLGRIEAIYDRRRELIEQEAAFFRADGISLVVADIPAIPLEAAARERLPRIAVGNFGWDWIYSEFIAQDSRWARIVDEVKQGYVLADLLLRLPFADEMKVFPRIEDLPVVASPGRERRAEIASLTGADGKRPWILVSFTSLEWDEDALDRVEQCAGYEFITVLPLAWKRSNLHAVDRDVIPFGDVVASVDAVLSKPGFGILSECVVNDKPLIYADRRDFLEYRVLEKSIRKYLRNIHIPALKLYRGELMDALAGLRTAHTPTARPALGGAQAAARRILDFL